MLRTSLAVSFAALLAASAVQAQSVLPTAPGVRPGATSAGSIAEKKAHVMARIQQKLGILQTLQSCVASAQDATSMRSCEEQARAANGAHEKKC
ncbi:MAG TPA: hypothetical protein VH328_08370 [Burkholderiaceae bacterium]|jgi:hypothetical protein|nr:hypothetical protein [Burkholderiaceae bacterium]